MFGLSKFLSFPSPKALIREKKLKKLDFVFGFSNPECVDLGNISSTISVLRPTDFTST